jgi:hypothetical protein
MLRIDPALPMLSIEPALPMDSMEPVLPMLRMLAKLKMLPTLAKLKTLNKLLALSMLATLTVPVRDGARVCLERAVLRMAASFVLAACSLARSRRGSLAASLTTLPRYVGRKVLLSAALTLWTWTPKGRKQYGSTGGGS